MGRTRLPGSDRMDDGAGDMVDLNSEFEEEESADFPATDEASESAAVELTIDEAELDAARDAVAADETGPGAAAFRRAAATVREFPRTPGVYLMKDSAGRVIYVGKAKILRSRAGSYF